VNENELLTGDTEYEDDDYATCEEDCESSKGFWLVIILVIVVMLSVLSILAIKVVSKYKDVYRSDIDISEVGKRYYNVIKQFDNHKTYIISPVATDLSINNFVLDSNLGTSSEISSVDMFSRGYKSFEDSTDWIESRANDYDIEYVKRDANEKALSYISDLDVEYEGYFSDDDSLCMYTVPTDFDGKVSDDGMFVGIESELLVSGDAYRINTSDGKYSILYYHDILPKSGTFKPVKGVLKLPKVSLASSSKMNCKLPSDGSKVSIPVNQLVTYSIDCSEENKLVGEEYIVNAPYRFLVYDNSSGLIISGGYISE